MAIFKAGGAMFLLETNYTPQLLADFMEAGELVQVISTTAMLEKLPASCVINLSSLVLGFVVVFIFGARRLHACHQIDVVILSAVGWWVSWVPHSRVPFVKPVKHA